jgi:HlyD family secretion protein
VKKVVRRLPLLVFLALVVAALVYGFMPHPIGVDLAVVERGSLLMTVDKEGKTRVKQRYVVTAPLAGKLLRIDFKPGADLEKLLTSGRPLAVLEPSLPPLLDARTRAETIAKEKAAEGRLGKAREELDKARKQEQHARTEHDRIERAHLTGSSSRQELDDCELKLRSAMRDLNAAQFMVQVAEFERDQVRATLRAFTQRNTSPGEVEPWRMEIPSPIARGKVLRVLQESESVVAAGTQILEVGDTELIEAEIDVLTQDAVKVRDGYKAFLVNWGGPHPLEGHVRLTEPSGFLKVSALGVEEQRVNVIIDFKVPKEYQGQVRDAYRVEARIVVWEGKNVLKVPAGALFRKGKNKSWAVYVVHNGKAELRELKIDHNNGLDAEVLEGLEEGDQVILNPGDKIKEGVAVVSRKEQ